MERNLIQRVEVAFPIDNQALQDRLIEECFTIPWQDDITAWDMHPDGSYTPRPADSPEKQKHPQKRLLKLLRA
jgi:polyphosphate kinase